MAVDRLAPEAILVATNLTGTVADIQDDPDSPDANWLTATNVNDPATDLRVSFPTFSGTLDPGQEFRVLVRKVGGTNTPSVTLSLYENGLLVSSAGAVTVTSTTGVVLTYTWDGTGRPPTDIEVHLSVSGQGGKATVKSTVEVGAVEWNAVYTAVVPSVTGASTLNSDTSLAVSGTVVGNVTADAPFIASTSLTADGTTAAAPSAPVVTGATTLSAATSLATGATVTAPPVVQGAATLASTTSLVTGAVVSAFASLPLTASTSLTTSGTAAGAAPADIVTGAATFTATTSLTSQGSAYSKSRLPPDAILTQTGSTGTLATVQDDPDSPDANYLTATGGPVTLHVTFPSPPSNLQPGTNLQEFRILLRRAQP